MVAAAPRKIHLAFRYVGGANHRGVKPWPYAITECGKRVKDEPDRVTLDHTKADCEACHERSRAKHEEKQARRRAQDDDLCRIYDYQWVSAPKIRALLQAGLIERDDLGTSPRRPRYHLTAEGLARRQARKRELASLAQGSEARSP